MDQFTPPGLYDVSIALLRALAAAYERHQRDRIPVVAYSAAAPVGRPGGPRSEMLPPSLAIALYKPTDVPPAFRRWFLDCPFAIAIPEAVWRACPGRLLDFAEEGDVIVLKERWDGPGTMPPSV